MNTNNFYISIGILTIVFIFLLIYIIPIPSIFDTLEESKTIHELNKECNSFVGILKNLNNDMKYLCSKYEKVYYLFIFGGILSISLIIFSLINLKQKEN